MKLADVDVNPEYLDSFDDNGEDEVGFLLKLTFVESSIDSQSASLARVSGSKLSPLRTALTRTSSFLPTQFLFLSPGTKGAFDRGLDEVSDLFAAWCV